MTTHDIFLAHNSQDKDFVLQLRDALMRESMKVWFDKDDIDPTESFNEALTVGIRDSRSVGICIGPNGLGPVHRAEIDMAIRQAQFASKRIMSIVLPGAKEEDRPELLRGRPPIIFKQSADERESVDLIIWGITGTKPDRVAQLRAAKPETPAAAPDPIEEAVGRVCVSRRNSELVIVVGPYSTLIGAEAIPGPHELSRNLLKEVNLLKDADSGPFPSFEDVGSCAAVRNGPDVLEAALCDRFPPYLGKIPTIYPVVAQLARKVLKGAQGRPRGAAQLPLLLTTNIDTALEQALLAEGIGMLRIVSDLSRECLRVNAVKAEKLEGGTLALTVEGEEPETIHPETDLVRFIERLPQSAQDYKLNDIESLSFTSAPGPILFKYHGSRGFVGSCATTAERYFRLAAHQGLVPRKLRERLSNSPTLLLGCGILTSTFQQLYAGILRDAFGQVEATRLIVYDSRRLACDPNWLLEAAAGSRLRDQIVKMSMDHVDADPEQFLMRLSARIS